MQKTLSGPVSLYPRWGLCGQKRPGGERLNLPRPLRVALPYSQVPWIGHNRLGLGFAIPPAADHIILRLHAGSCSFLSISLTSESCSSLLEYSPKIFLFLFLEGLYMGGGVGEDMTCVEF